MKSKNSKASNTNRAYILNEYLFKAKNRYDNICAYQEKIKKYQELIKQEEEEFWQLSQTALENLKQIPGNDKEPILPHDLNNAIYHDGSGSLFELKVSDASACIEFCFVHHYGYEV